MFPSAEAENPNDTPMTTNQLIELIRKDHNNADCLAQIAGAVEAMREQLSFQGASILEEYMNEVSKLDPLDRAFLRRAATDHLKRYGNGEEIGSSDVSSVLVSWFSQHRDFRKVVNWINEEC